jgi:hypothetical protein
MPNRSSAPGTVDPAPVTPLGGTRAQALQRLQVGGSLLIGIVLIVGLANVIEDRAKQSDQSVVPEAAATVAPDPAQTSANDPLADAGVVPDLPAEPSATAAAPTGAPPRRNDAQ